jgi:hypothetical protein
MRRFVCFSYTLPAGAAITQRPSATTHWKRVLPLLLLAVGTGTAQLIYE